MIAKQSSRIGFKRVILIWNASIPFMLNTMKANADPEMYLQRLLLIKYRHFLWKIFTPFSHRYKRVIARLSVLLSKWSESYTREKSAKIPVICLIKLKLEEIVFAPYRVECYRLSSKQRGLPKIAEHQWLEAVRASAGRRSRNLNLLPPLAKYRCCRIRVRTFRK